MTDKEGFPLFKKCLHPFLLVILLKHWAQHSISIRIALSRAMS